VSGWWAGRVRQFVRHLTGRVAHVERRHLASWLSPAQLALFDSMHRADRRHGLDVVSALRRAGHSDTDLLLAGLLHDCGKGSDVGLWHRVGWALAEHHGGAVESFVRRLPGFAAAFQIIAVHAERSAELALAAGCSPRCAELIRQQAAPPDSELGRALQLADQAN